MGTAKLTAADFARMGVHRPLLVREINEIHPQAVVDKTTHPKAQENELGKSDH
jgi:hypothetical protein